jgi:simple sugar transport system ATP-binding protein
MTAATNTEVAPRLSLKGIRKVYPSVVANDGIDLDVSPGEIHAVLGENGAGKSTLMKIICGVTRQTSGEMSWEGHPIELRNPAHARNLGIGMVFQHFSLFETLTVSENVALALPGKPKLTELSRRIESISVRYGLEVQPDRHIHGLSVGERQRVEIIRCLLQNPKLLIMDEPTSVLTPHAVSKLFETLRLLSDEGCSILYISHKLNEIKELCHRATVLRGGKVTGHCAPADETTESLARLMIGKDLPPFASRSSIEPGEVQLALHGLSRSNEDPFMTDLHDIDLEVRSGEIVGIAGVSGNGQQELLRAISGEATILKKNSVQILGIEAGSLGPDQRRRLGMCFVPEERLGRGAVPSMSLTDNATLTGAKTLGFLRYGFLSAARAKAFASNCISIYNVKCSGPEAIAQSLSGGNLQKFIIGREILQAPRLLILAQPTWGVDVGAAALIREAIVALRNQGCAVLVISEELEELFEICDRIAVIAKGRLSPPQAVAQTTVEDIGKRMSGLWTDSKAGQPGVKVQQEVTHVV